MAPDSSTDWQQLEHLFYEALALAPGERTAFLDRTCQADLDLRQRVEDLIAAEANSGGFLEQIVRHASEDFHAADPSVGVRIGAYKLLRVLGQGGMGTVYLASRDDDLYQQQVAIKVTRAEFGHTPGMVLRFGAERQILANLDHPNIARLFDGGITADGTSYLVMEYVKGISIDAYCLEARLNTAERLRLFLKVCSAVDYAHANLVVHRDIKPANILVTSDGVPKLLDFGIARLLGPETPATLTMDRMMTPEYASPEQVRGERVTTATDVYALGVLLYEMLAGIRPFRLATSSPLEAAQIICEREPTPPSEMSLSHPSEACPDSRRTLRGDLDNIVLTALRKEPSRRYVSVSAFAEDVQAYLTGYPVKARHDTWNYRAGKFIRRHKAGVTSAVCMVLALIGFSIGMALLAQRATRQKIVAQRESEFLVGIFQAATPDEAKGKEITARQLLDQAAKRIETQLSGDLVLQVPLLDNIGYAYQRLGQYPEAQTMLQRSYALQKRDGGSHTLDFARTEDYLGTVLRLQTKYTDAEPFFRDSLAIIESKLGEDNLKVAETLAELGECLYLEDRGREAEAVLRRALVLNRKLDPNSGIDTRNYLALALENDGGYQEAGQLLREALEIARRTEGTDAPEYLIVLHNLAGAQIDSGDLATAEATERQDLALRVRIEGLDHPDTTYSLNNLGWILLEKGDWRSAEPYLAQNLRIVRTNLGEQSPRTASAMTNWGRMLEQKGDYSAAEHTYQQALEILQRSQHGTNLTASKVLGYFGQLKLDQGDYREAERYDRQSLEMRRKLTGESTPLVASSLIDLAEALDLQGDSAEAEPLLRQALDIRTKTLTPGHMSVISLEVRLGEVLLDEHKTAAAEPVLRKAVLAAHQSPFPLFPWQIAEAEIALGTCMAAEGKTGDGLKFIRQSEVPLRGHPSAALRRASLQRASAFVSK